MAAWRAKPLVSRCAYPVLALAAVTVFANPDGIIAYVPRPVFIAVREARERFFLFGRRSRSTWVLPKRALSDQSAVQELGGFLRASAAKAG